MRKKLVFISFDALLLFLTFLVLAWIKMGSIISGFQAYWDPFVYIAIIWIPVSYVFKKYSIAKVRHSNDVIFPVIISNFIILSIVAIIFYSIQQFSFAKTVAFGTIVSALELFFGLIYLGFRASVQIDREFEYKLNGKFATITGELIGEDVKHPSLKKGKRLSDEAFENIKNLIIGETGEAVFNFINNSVDIRNPANLVISTTTRFNILNQPDNRYINIINLARINNIRYFNKFFETVNSKIPDGGIFIGNAETYVLRKQRIMKKFPHGLNVLYYAIDFIWVRVFPKMPVLKKFYFFVTRGQKRVVSKAEVFGRIYSCGFKITNDEFVNGSLLFCAQKIREPYFDYNPTYGPIIRLRRIGKKGKIIKVYKMRTMHAYSEYIQGYVFDKNQLQEGGKFMNDFRITSLGKFMRKFWIDELPMLLNILKGDLKLVGIRPLSRHYFSLYSKEMQERRVRYKPGLIPPYYAHMPKTFDDIQESERSYMDEYDRHPFLTDWRYFWYAWYNILFKRARSK